MFIRLFGLSHYEKLLASFFLKKILFCPKKCPPLHGADIFLRLYFLREETSLWKSAKSGSASFGPGAASG